MSKPDFDQWTKRQLWTLVDVACLLSDVEPIRPVSAFDRSESTGGQPAAIYNDLKDSIDLGGIEYVESREGKWESRRVEPAAAIAWARARGHMIPKVLNDAFPKDRTSPSEQPGVSDGAIPLLTRSQVMGMFCVKADVEENSKWWDARLDGSKAWMQPAMAQRGKPGTSSLWQPLLVASCLLDKNAMTLVALDKIVSKHLPQFVDQWQAMTEDRR